MLPGHYSSVEDALQKMKELVDNENRYTDDARFSYDNLKQKGHGSFEKQRRSLAKWYGLYAGVHFRTNYFKTTKGDRQVDLEYGFHDLFSFIVILFSYNMLAMHGSLCFELFP